MDYTTTAEESCSLLSFRIRSPRSRKHAVREDRIKQLISLQREERYLDKLNRELGFEPLDPPIQRGFERTYALREDVARSVEGPFYQGILNRINTKQYHPYRHFKQKKNRKGRKIYVPIEQSLQQPEPCSFRKLAFTEKEAACFELYPFYAKGRVTPDWYYRFREAWRFVLKVRPHMIDKRKVESVWIESREQEIENYLRGGRLRCKLARLKSWRGTRYHSKETGKYPRQRFKFRYKPGEEQ